MSSPKVLPKAPGTCGCLTKPTMPTLPQPAPAPNPEAPSGPVVVASVAIIIVDLLVSQAMIGIFGS